MRENFRKLVEKKIFAEKTFADCLLVPPKDTMVPNFLENTFANSHKTSKFVKVFSLESFPLYGIMHLLTSNSHTTEHSTSIEDVDRFIDALKQKVVRIQELW